MSLRRFMPALALLACVCALGGGSAYAAGEEIVVETAPLNPAVPQQWIDYSVATTQAARLLGYATCLKLLDYDEETGDLRPEAAAAMPSVSSDGRTYTFTVGSGHQFFRNLENPPTTEDVTAASFKRAVERATSPAMAASIGGTPPAREAVAGVVGASAFFDGTASSIAGIQAVGNALTVELVDRDAIFLHRISSPYFCATESSASAGFSLTVPSSAGPYFVSSAFAQGVPPNLQHEIVLQRNPFYGGSRTRNLGTIRWVQMGSPLSEDYVAATPVGFTAPPGMSVVPTVTTGVQLFALNTSRQPFQDVLMRRAAARALDRVALSSVLAWQPTDQFVSPLLPGYADSDVYPLGGDPDGARAILGTATPSVTLCHPGGARGQVALNAKAQLEAVGFVVTEVLPQGNYFTYIGNPANCDLALFGSTPDFPDGSRILEALFYGGARPNFSFFNDPEFNARFAAARTLTPESARVAAYAELDAHLSDSAVAIPIGYDVRHDAFASRIGCRFPIFAVFGYAANRLCISVEEETPPGGTASTGAEATPAAPLQTDVFVPSGGPVVITQGVSTTAVPPEFRFLEQRLDITAPSQTPPSFLTFTFELDASLLAGPPAIPIEDVVPYRNGVPVADCTGHGPGIGGVPCVASRSLQPDGDGEIVVRSMSASVWEFGERYDPAEAVTSLEALAAQRTPLGAKARDALKKTRSGIAKLARTPPDRQGALGEFEGAVGDLEAALKRDPAATGQLVPIMVELAGTARQIALVARQQAIDRGGNAAKIADASAAIAEGDARWAADRFKDAVAKYKDAVSKAEGA